MKLTFPRRSRAVTAKKMQKKFVARTKLLLFLLDTFRFACRRRFYTPERRVEPFLMWILSKWKKNNYFKWMTWNNITFCRKGSILLVNVQRGKWKPVKVLDNDFVVTSINLFWLGIYKIRLYKVICKIRLYMWTADKYLKDDVTLAVE